MILPASDTLDNHSPSSNKFHVRPEVESKLKTFSELHHKCYVFLCAPMIGTYEQGVLTLLQDSFFSSSLQFLPVHNSKECTECMLSISKVTCEPLSVVIRERFVQLRDQVISEQSVMGVLTEMGVDERQSMFLLDGCRGLAGVARAAKRKELVDYNIDKSLIMSIEKLLNSRV